jgi:hypothetical protein
MKIFQAVQNLLVRDRQPFLSDRRHLQYHHLYTKFHAYPPTSSNIIRGFLCTHLRSLNVRHFGMAEGTGLENMASRSSSMAIQLYPSVQKVHPLQKFNVPHFGLIDVTCNVIISI